MYTQHPISKKLVALAATGGMLLRYAAPGQRLSSFSS